ncbi:hypothetical protein GCM10027596_08920 [Nocardioides korecus]
MSSDSELSAAPEPTTDPAPEDGPGGPADVVERDQDDLPLVTPDQPRSAQVEDHEVPDGLEDPEELDEGEKDVDPAEDEPV